MEPNTKIGPHPPALRDLAVDGGDIAQEVGAERSTRRWHNYLAVISLVVQQNRSGRYIQMEVAPTSPRGRKVMFCIPAGVRGGGWLALAESCSWLIEVAARGSLSDCLLWRGRQMFVEAVSFAEVVRDSNEGLALVQEKKVSISLTLIGGDDQWRNLSKSLEVARKWVKSCEFMEGNSALKREIVGFKMEVKIEELVEEPAAKVR